MNTDLTSPARQLDDAAIDVGPLLGAWKNVNSNVDFISNLQIAGRADGNLAMRLFDATTVVAECTAQAFTSPQSSEAVGFYASFELADATTTIAANAKLGILVLQCYTEFPAGSGRNNLLTREFYRRDPAPEPVDPDFDGQASPGAASINAPARNKDYGFLAGRWVNTHAKTQWVTAAVISDEAGWSIAMSQHGPEQPPAVPLTPFVFDTGEFGFSARLEFEGRASAYAAYSNKGLIVMSGFHEWEERGHRQHVMSREFYFVEV